MNFLVWKRSSNEVPNPPRSSPSLEDGRSPVNDPENAIFVPGKNGSPGTFRDPVVGVAQAEAPLPNDPASRAQRRAGSRTYGGPPITSPEQSKSSWDAHKVLERNPDFVTSRNIAPDSTERSVQDDLDGKMPFGANPRPMGSRPEL